VSNAKIKLPSDWELKSLGEIATVTGGKRLPKGKILVRDNTGHPYIRVSDMKAKGISFDDIHYVPKDVIDIIQRYRVYEGDIYISVAGTLGLVGKVPKELTGANLTENADRISNIEGNSDYLLYCLRSQLIQDIINREKTTNAQPKLALMRIKSFPIPLPRVSEQQKIADILTSVDNTISKTEAIIKQTEKAKKGLMQQLLTKGIGHTKFKQTEIGEIPEEWELLELGKLADPSDRYSLTGGPFGSDLKSEEYTVSGIRIIQLQNIKDGYFSDEYKIYTSELKADELRKCNIYPGDIIIAKMAEPVARACIIPDIEDRYIMASDGIRLSVDKNSYSTQFVTYAINSNYFRQQAIDNSTGSTRLRIGLKTLRQLKIIIPSFYEQKRIEKVLLSFDLKLNTEEKKLSKLRTLKQGLMQVLLTGKVRVKVDKQEVI
jgi:type I restriction enzyme S subunit